MQRILEEDFAGKPEKSPATSPVVGWATIWE